MPEPLSILANATAMVQLAEFAYNFAEAIHSFTKLKPDRELNELASEIRSIGGACKGVHGQLEEMGTMQNHVDSTLSECFINTIADCTRTMEQLEGMVNSIRDRQSTWDRKVHFLRRKEAMSDIRKRIHSHVLALQLILQTLNINVSYIAPQIANQTLQSEISDLRELINKQERRMAALHISDKAAGGALEDKHIVRTLVQCAREVVSSGETLYEGSIAACSTAAESVCEEARRTSRARVDHWLTGQARKRSLKDSTIETPEQPPRKRTSSHSAVGTEHQSSLSANADSHSSITGLSVNSFGRDSLEQVGRRPCGDDAPEHDEDDGPEDDINLELLQKARTAGQTAFSKSEYEVAMSRFRASLQLIQRLPIKWRPVIDDIYELKYQVAVCVYQVERDYDPIEDALCEVLQQEASSDMQLRQQFHASHLLAQLYTCIGRMERARECCENALRGRRKLFEKQGHEYFCSLALMHKISELQGDVDVAQGYLELIPHPGRRRYSNAYENLSTNEETPFRTTLDVRLEQATFDDQDILSTQPESSLVQLVDVTLMRPEVSDRESRLDCVDFTERRNDYASQTTSVSPSRLQLDVAPATYPTTQSEHSNTGNVAPSSGAHRRTEHAPGSWSSATQAYDRGGWLKTLRISPSNELQDAVARRHIDEALDLIQSRSFSQDMPDEQGLSALHLAALFGETDLVPRLILNGSDINGKFHPLEANEYFDQGATPILLAVAARKFEVVEQLFKYGASYTDRSGRCNLPMWLLHARWLTLTDCQDPKEIIDMLHLLQTSANLGVNDSLSSGNFLLHRALRTAGYFTRLGIAFWFEIVEYLLDAGAYRDSLSPFGAKPLHIACSYHNETDIMELLLDMSTEDVNDEFGNDRPLKLALKNQNAISSVRLEMAKLLLESGASVTSVDREGRDAWSLIHTMTREGRVDYQAALLSLLGQYGDTPVRIDSVS